ncbi:uncharacterized protein LOC134910412 isoform X2 [Pseudophryne corroboree]|uniref:uncharacterized protein LOC134910412 isoform X2 n=1 Tax=Pseudophryne corroboree TaxID=495146 RepID=UPI0030816D43
MNNCDLEKLSVSGVKLEPPFKPDITNYKATVPNQLTRISVDACPSDTGASYTLLGGGGSKYMTLKDGINDVIIEVTAEDGTVKKYTLEVTRLSASHSSLEGISLSKDLYLVPSFDQDVFEYSCNVPYFQRSISVEPSVQDSQMKVTVNGHDDNKPVSIAVGDTVIEVLVLSADGTKSQVYSIIVTRAQLPFCAQFADAQEQMTYECPITLTAFYRPVSIKGSNPKHTISGSYMDLLTRRSKTDPLDETVLSGNWRVPEYELDMDMSAANVSCVFAYRGCGDIIKLSEFGDHARSCLFKPPTDLDPKTVTESEWYKEDFSTSKSSEPYLKHTVQERNWEKRLQQVPGSNVDSLCCQAEEQLRLYEQNLPKSGDVLDYKEGKSPLDALSQAAMAYASAIKLNPKSPNLHFHLATVLEEFYYAAKMYGIRKKIEGDGGDYSSAKATGKAEEIQAICKLHGFSVRPNLEQQLKALDLEYHQLKEQGQSSRADYIQNLYAWKSKQSSKTGWVSLDEENPLAQAFLKYKDALSLDPDNWQYNMHVGRHLLLQKQHEEALMFLQNSLALRPASAIARCYLGLALIEQESGAARIQESATYLQQGLEKLLIELVAPESVADWSAKALFQCPHRGSIAQELEWVLLETSFHLLKMLAEEAFNKEEWIRRRCQALSALIRLTSIPECKELLDMHEKVCQLGVIVSPCNSYALYLLGTAQLAHYDDRPSSEDAQLVLQEAKLSFTASIRLENMPTRGPPPAELTSQKWWQEWEAAKEMKTVTPGRNSTKTVAPGGANITTVTPGGANARTVAPGGTNAKKVTPGGSHTKTMTHGEKNTKTLTPIGSNNKIVTPGGRNTKMVTPAGSNTKTLTPGGSNTKMVTPAGSNTKTLTPGGSNTKMVTPAGSNTKTLTPGGSNTKMVTPAGSNTRTLTPGGSNTKTVTPAGSSTKTVTPGGSNTKIVTAEKSNSTTVIPRESNKKTSTPGGSNSKSVPPSVARGHSSTVLSKVTTTFPTSIPEPQVSSSIKPAEQSSSSERPATVEDKLGPVQEAASGLVPVNGSSFLPRLGLARALSRNKKTETDASAIYQDVIKMAPEVPDAYTELAEMFLKSDPLSAVEVYCQYPQKPDQEQSFEDAFIPGEIVRLLIKCDKYDDPRLPVNMISYGKVMGIGCLEKYINILEEKFKTSILKRVYAGIHGKAEDDEELQDFFRFKYWI